MTTIASSGIRPFAATFHNETLYVIESGLPSLKNAALSTYLLNGGRSPSLTALTKSERNDQTDGCWVVVTPDGKWAYTANFVSGSISSYRLAGNGTASLINGTAALPGGVGSEPVDLALSADGKYLYNLLRGSGAVAGFQIQADGSLKEVGELFGKGKGLPAMDGASGLAAY
jgi:6-phosphogluconolactonase (cycloisomerase 2 family)